MKIPLHVTIDQPIAVVFDQIADARNEAKWNSTLSDYTLASGEPIGKGSQFTYRNRGNEFHSVLAEYNKPSSLTFEVSGKPMDITAHVALTAKTPGVTVVDAVYELRPKGFMKVAMLVFGPFLGKAFEKEFENFKHFSESQSVSSMRK